MDDRNRNSISADNGNTKPNSKVARVVEKYGLTGFGDELEHRWTGQAGERQSLRELAKHLNHHLLRAAIERADMQPLDGEIENMYRLLTDKDVSSGMRTQAETTLQREGINVEELRRDFVSHQAVHTYLTEYRDVDGPSRTSDENQVNQAIKTVERLKSRLVAVVKNNLGTLRETERISIGEFGVLVDVRVFCEDCSRQYDVVDLLRNGGCECKR